MSILIPWSLKAPQRSQWDKTDSVPPWPAGRLTYLFSHLWPCLVLLTINATPRGGAKIEMYMSPFKTKTERELTDTFHRATFTKGDSYKTSAKIPMSTAMRESYISKSGHTKQKHFLRAWELEEDSRVHKRAKLFLHINLNYEYTASQRRMLTQVQKAFLVACK